MAIKKPFGGERLGSGDKLKFDLRTFGRSTHNLSTIARLDQAVGTLVPYKVFYGKKGDKFNIPLRTQLRTLPTNGPIFGSFKWQVDVFMAPLRLYNKLLHNNYTGIGLKMQKVYIPQVECLQDDGTYSGETDFDKKADWKPADGFQINDSSLWAMLGNRAQPTLAEGGNKTRIGCYSKEGASLLMYWEIYKNYYSNKQEEEGVVIGPGMQQVPTESLIGNVTFYEKFYGVNDSRNVVLSTTAESVGGFRIWDTAFSVVGTAEQYDYVMVVETTQSATTDQIRGIKIKNIYNGADEYVTIGSLSSVFSLSGSKSFRCNLSQGKGFAGAKNGQLFESQSTVGEGISLNRFPLTNIDDMRMAILEADKTVPFIVNTVDHKMAENLGLKANETEPYKSSVGMVRQGSNGVPCFCYDQAGLGIRTYLSDRFNNWVNTEWIEGASGVAGLTDIDVSDGKLSMDALNIAMKMYRMTNRISASDGTYDSWLEATTGERAERRVESPIFCGGKSDEIVFEEITSMAEASGETGSQPLGTLAGRGALRGKDRTVIHIKLNEPAIIMVIGSIVPRVDYGQGNEWYTRLENIDQIHKPDLDAIAFQDLLTDEFAGADTKIVTSAESTIGTLEYHGVGKQVSWQQYMTETNHSYGGFAPGRELDFMVLNRTYHYDGQNDVQDATTYIDPRIFNHVFADETLNAKNFWVQTAIDAKARRKMSAKQIPNL